MDEASLPVLVPLRYVWSWALTEEAEDCAESRMELAADEAENTIEAVTDETTSEVAAGPMFLDGLYERWPWAEV